MSNRLKAGKHLLLSCSALFPVLFAGATPALAQAVNLGGAGNLIIPDGRTETSVSSSGATTDIRTSTVRGQVGFNSFSKFEAGSGNTVNLHLPDGTGTLVNIVRDAPVVVEGTVNALKNGLIGGNVVFSDPYGFVLGKGGVINTGGLTVNTPTREFLDQAIDGHGRIDTAKTDRLISGDVPLSPDGSVVIRGRVNAQTHIDINAQSIDVDGEAVLKRHREDFEGSVNTAGGVAQGGALVVRNGRISLVAAGDVKIGGSVAARATSRESAKAGAGRVSIKGRNVTVTPTARIEALAAIAREDGADAVAAAIGIEAAGSLGMFGTIEARGLGGAGAAVKLSAAEDLALDGRIEALGSDGTKGKRVDVTAGRDIAMGATSAIDASGGEGTAGGDVYVVAMRDLSVADGASVVSRGAGDTDGGFAELSGHRAVQLGAVSVDLRSEGSGKAGTLLIDPTDIVIDSTNSRTIQANLTLAATNTITVKSGGSIRSAVNNGKAYDLSLEAAAIIVEGGGTIDSRALDSNGNVVGNSGSITLSAATISLLVGSTVRADAAPGFAAGNVQLLAYDGTFQRSGVATSAAQIAIAGTLKGANIKALAVARASSLATELDFLNPNFTLSLMDAAQATLLAARLAGLPAFDGGLLSASTVARVDVASTADIKATHDLTLQAVAEQVASNLGVNVTGGSVLQLTGFYGVVDADTAVSIASGATLSAANDLTITARNKATLDVNAMSLGLKDTPISGAFAMGVANVRTMAKVSSGATVKVGGNVRIAADNLNSFSVASTVMATKDGVAGTAVAVHLADASATASLGASIVGLTGATSSAAGTAGSVSVTALSETLLNRTTASTDLGDGFVNKKVRAALPDPGTGALGALTGFLFNETPFAALSQDAMPKGGMSLALTIGSQTATAEIGTGVDLKLTGNLAVASSVLDAQVRSNATASINSSDDPAQGPKTTTGIGVAIAYADVDHVSHATIGNNATIRAANVGVAANSSLPINITYNNLPTNPTDWIKFVVNQLNGNAGVVKNILTSYASTDVEAEKGLGATLNYLSLGHDVLSWIGSGASITTTDTGSLSWSLAPSMALSIQPSTDSLEVARSTSTASVPSFQNGVDVQAHSDTATINIAGNPAWFLVVGGNASTDRDGKSFGGALNLNMFSARTVAGIGAGAHVVSARDVRVIAEREDTVFAVAPTSGKGAGFGINGILSLLLIANETSASISDKAVVEAQAVDVLANQRNNIVAIAGSVNTGSGSNVGIAANWTNIDTETAAFVGDNASLVTGTSLANAAGLAAGSLKLTSLGVRASTSGETYALSVAGAVSAPDDGQKGKVANARDSLSNAILPKYARLNYASKTSGTLTKLTETVKGGLAKLSGALAAPAPVGQSRDFSMSAAGSVTGASITATTEAYLDGATILSLASASFPVTVQATNDSLISITSGGASVALAGQSSANKSAAVAGAVAIAVTDGATRATIRNSTLTDAGATRVAAIASGQQIVIGLGLAVNTNANSSSSIAGSVSLGLVFDNVNALVETSTLTAKSGTVADIDVKAYQNTDIGIGGLAISVATSGSGGYGLALSGTVVADAADPTNPNGRKSVSALVAGSSVTSYRNLTVDAATLGRIMSGAGAVGVAPNGLGVTGSIVFNDFSGTTIASISGTAQNKINVGGSVLVRSGTVRESDIAAEIAAVTSNKAILSGFDFSQNVFNTSSTGAVIFAVAGSVGAGQNGVGVSLLYNGVRNVHRASIEGVDVDAVGDVTVSAKDDTKIIGMAAGVGGASGDFGGAGSLVIQVVANRTEAAVTGATATLDARDISVIAANESSIIGGAGAVGFSLSAAGTGLGLSLINGTIANDTTATIERASLTAVRDVDVAATSGGDILSFAVSVGVGNAAGIAGSVTTQVSANDAKALVQGASVSAQNNVSVAASNEDEIHVTSGAVGLSLQGAGVGVSTTVNIIRGDTSAAIESSNGVASTIVARGTGTAKTVDDGKVLNAYDLGGAASTANTLIALTPDLRNGTRTVSGLSVNAISHQTVGSASLSVGIGRGIAVAINPILNVLGGTTEARITDASVNRTGSANDAADVAVIAASNTFVQNGLLTVAGSAGGAGAAGLSSNVMQRETDATVTGASIGASGSVGAVDVEANGTMTSVNLVAGLAVGSGGAAGSVVLNVFDAATTAELSGGSVNATSLGVTATGDSAFLGAAGAGAGGGSAGAGAMNLAFNLGSTRAVVGSTDTVLTLVDDLTVAATSHDDHRAYVVGAAVGSSGFAVAGMLNFSVLMSDTIASVQNLRSSSMRDLSVTARNEVALTPVTGGFALSAGSVGVGAAVNVMLTKSTVAAELLNSDFTARRDLSVKAYGVRKSDMTTATLGAGGSTGIGASIGIFVAGIGMSNDAKAELGDTLTSANSQSNQSASGSFGGSGTAGYRADQPEAGTSSQKASDPDSLQRQNLVASALSSTQRDGVTATIGGSGVMSAQTTTVLADSRIESKNTAYGIGLGGTVGVGAALGFSFVNQTVAASVDVHNTGSGGSAAAGSLSVSSLSVSALSGMPGSAPAVAVKSYAGAGSLGGSLGAAAAVGQIDSAVQATIGGTVTASGRVAATADDQTSVEAEAVGAAVGGGAIGVSIAMANRNADIAATIGPDSTVQQASGVFVTATSGGSVKATGIAGAGGVFGGGVGASGNASETSQVLALIGEGSTLSGIGADGVTVAASARPNVRADSVGVAVGGAFAVGASVAIAKAEANVRALVAQAASIGTSGLFSLTADLLKTSGQESVYATARAGSGSLYFAAQGTVARALTTGTVEAKLGDDVGITATTGNLTVRARSGTRQRADVTGIAVSGGLSLGATVADAQSDLTTTASIGARATISGVDLYVLANGDDENIAKAVSGAGGVIAGSAAAVKTATTSDTSATIGAGNATKKIALVGKLTVAASHLGTIGGSVDSINAGLVGASGASATHTVSSLVNAAVGDGAYVEATDLDVAAVNRTHRLFLGETAVDLRTASPSFNVDAAGWTLNSGSGGLLNLPAGASQMTVSQVTSAVIGKNARVNLNPIGVGATSAADISAYNELIVHDKVKLDSGGAIALADTRTTLDVTQNSASVVFDDGSQLILSNGDIRAAAYDNAHLDLRAASTTYGIAGAPSGSADIDYNRSNLVRVSKSARVEANNLSGGTTGTIKLSAGADLAGTLSRIRANATIDLFNNTAIPIPTVPNPSVRIAGDSLLSIEGDPSVAPAVNTGVRAAGDISLTASRGTIEARAVGTGKDIYRETLSALASAVSGLFGGAPISFDYKGGETNVTGLGIATVNGVVETGINRDRALTVSYASANVGSCLINLHACLIAKIPGQIDYTFVDGIAVGTTITDRLAELRGMLSQYNADPVAKGAFAAEIAFLEAKLVAAGFSKDGTPGNTNLESPLSAATREIGALGEVLRASDEQFAAKASVGLTAAVNSATTTASLSTTGTSVVSKVDDTITKANAITVDLKALGGYDATASKTDLDAVTAAIAANTTLSGEIATQNTAIATSRQTIATAKQNIDTQTATVATERAAIALLDPELASNAAAIKAHQDTIVTAQTSIKSSIATVETQLAAIETATGTIATKKAGVAANLTTITDGQKAIAGRSGTALEKTAIQARLDQLTATGTTIASGFDTIATGKTATTASLTAMKNAASSDPASTLTLSGLLDNAVTERITYVSSDDTLRRSLSTLSSVAAGTPTTGEIRVADTVVRLGSIAVTADRLEGQGYLVSPGDASISIVNQTANNLVVNNLTILSDSGGKIRLNGALVDSNQDINRLNLGTTGAAFQAITTALTQGATRPTITIRNEYSAEGTGFYNPVLRPTSAGYDTAARTAFFDNNSFYAPDLTIASAKTISNVTGAVSLFSQTGSIYSNGTIEANSVSIVAKNGDFVQSYTYGFNHVKGDPQAGTPSGIGIIANGAVAISARYLNINGVVQSGMAERFVTIGAAPTLQASPTLVATLTGNATSQSQLEAWDALYKGNLAKGLATQEVYSLSGGLSYRVAVGTRTGRLEFDVAYAKTHASQLNNTARLVEAYASGDPTDATARAEIMDVSYDIAADRFVVDSTNVRGGLIQLYGQIMNTSATGAALRVLDGYGQIKISNVSGKDVVIGRLDTGEDTDGTGRGVRGRIDLTDIRSVTPLYGDATQPNKVTSMSVLAKQTTYTREIDTATGAFRVVERATDGYLDAGGLFASNSSQATSYGSGRTSSYDPQAGLRYLTLSGEDSSLVTITQYKGTQFFGSSDLRTSPTGTVQGTPTSYVNDRYLLPAAATVAIDTVHQNDATYTPTPVTANSSNTTYVKTAEWRKCNWWTLCIASDYNYIIKATTPRTTITTTSSKADHAIGIDFIGADTGTVDVASNANVLLNGAINNRTGTTTISSSSGNILQASDAALITSRTVNLTAAGSVGGLGTGKAVEVALGTAGTLNANAANGNVVVEARSNLGVGTIKAAGDVTQLLGRVVLTSAGSIAGTGASLVQAKRVELTAASGSIGAGSGALVVNTGFSSVAADRPFGDPDLGFIPSTYYGLKASAAGDIDIESKAWSGNSDGTILVDRVVSAGGDVTLTTPGSILDNNPIQSVDTRTYSELETYWASLDLFGTAAQAKPAAVIATFERQATTERTIYNQLLARSGSTAYDPAYAYAMTASERLGFEASLKLTEPTLSGADIAARATAYEAGQTARYHDIHASQALLTGTFDPVTGAYSASTDEMAARSAGAAWSLRQLAFSLSPGALKTITGTNPVLKASNVSGRTVTLNAAKGLGEVAATVAIPTNIRPQDITPEQKIALATAERSDFVSNGSNGVIEIRSIRPLNFDAATQVNAIVSASGANAYLATTGDARLGAIDVPGELRLKARGSIVNAAGTPDVIAGSYILEASGGGIGYSRNVAGTSVAGTLTIKPVNTTGTAGAYGGTVIARAADAIDLSVEAGTGANAEGDANLDTVYSRKSIKVVAAKSIRNANGDKLINVLGDSVDLEAQAGSIGEAGNRLNVGNGLSGQLDAAATGAIYLFTPDGQHLTLNDVIANGGVLSVVAGDALNGASAVDVAIAGLLQASAGLDLSATGRIAALGTASVSALGGDLSVGAGSLRMLTGSGFSATGKIAVTTTGDALVTGLVSGASASDAVRITSGARILGGTAAGRTDVATTGAGSGVVLAAATGIGSKRVANDTRLDASETAVLNPLRLDTGLADLRSGTGGIAARFLGDVDAFVRDQGGSVDLSAAGTFTSTFVGADQGSVRIDAARPLSIDTLAAADAVAVQSTGDMTIGTVSGGRVALGSGGSVRVSGLQSAGAADVDAAGGLMLLRAVTGGTQRLTAKDDLVFDYLQTLGIASDPGDIYLTSRQGSALGGEALANRDLVIDARKDLAFTKLTALRDLQLTVGGALKGSNIDAGRELLFDVAGDAPIRLATLRGSNLKMSGNGPLVIDEAIVSRSARLEGSSITVSKLTYTGSDPLILALSGYRGRVADAIAMTIDAVPGIRIEDLRVADSRFVTNASQVQIERGFVTGTMQLVTADRTVWMNNRTSRPTLGNDIQLFKPGFAFALDQSGNRTLASSYVVRYGGGTDAQMVWNGDVYPGASFVRDFERALQTGSNERASGISARSLTRITVDAVMSLFRNALSGPISAPLDRPAVRTTSETEDEREEAAVR